MNFAIECLCGLQFFGVFTVQPITVVMQANYYSTDYNDKYNDFVKSRTTHEPHQLVTHRSFP
jgi:hypothetical protein